MTLDATNFAVAKLARDLETIKRAVAEAVGLTVAGLLAPSRREPLVTHRQMAMLICREMTPGSFPDIAAAFGKDDHNTVIHACHAAFDKAETDKATNETLIRLRRVAKEALENESSSRK